MADELIRLDTTIIGIDSLINKASTAEEAKVLFTAKDVIYSQQRYFADVQPVIVIHSRWIPTGDGTYNAYCENCGQERGSKSWNKNDFKYCFGCGARMDLDSVTHDRCSNYMDCDGSCFIDDTPCDCNGNIEKCKGR